MIKKRTFYIGHSSVFSLSLQYDPFNFGHLEFIYQATEQASTVVPQFINFNHPMILRKMAVFLFLQGRWSLLWPSPDADYINGSINFAELHCTQIEAFVNQGVIVQSGRINVNRKTKEALKDNRKVKQRLFALRCFLWKTGYKIGTETEVKTMIQINMR